MKKAISMLILISVILLIIVPMVHAAGISVSASVNKETKLVTIEGVISSGAGKQVTVVVVNPAGGVDYTDQTTSGEGGKYQFTYTLSGESSGAYLVYIGGSGVSSQNTTFNYDTSTPTPTPLPTLTPTSTPSPTPTTAPTSTPSPAPTSTPVPTVTPGNAAGITVNASVSNDTRLVTIEGVISTGEGKQVTVVVLNPAGGVDYTDQTTSAEGGKYRFTYTLDEENSGTYWVSAGGSGVSTVNTTFNYTASTATLSPTPTPTPTLTPSPVPTNPPTATPTPVPGNAAAITASASVDNSTKKVTIEGEISTGAGKQITVTVINPSGGVDYTDQTTSGEKGSFKFSYILDEDSDGTYTVNIGGTGVDNPLVTTFKYAKVSDECFIATAAYGSKFEPSVVLLRHFRDKFLLSNPAGRAFVDFYYKNSPPVAHFIAGHKVLKFIVRMLLIPYIITAFMALNPVYPMAIIILSILAIIRKSKKARLI